ncbi:MAG: Photosystem I reaction center subunit III [Cyanobacteria bacterium QS_8_64_29]|jgi:photosystem I subunit 3|nr:MAG: Photosystem I reaction center subunit III [Cyanobacteria bacterium QS_8_64_29]
MKRLLALALVAVLWLGFVPAASAQQPQQQGQLVRCSESEAFQKRAQNFRNTTADPQSGQKRAQRYSQALCGPEGLPHLVVDGRLDRAGDFLIPSILFLYIAGWIGWVGRAYLNDIKQDKNPEQKEIVIDVPRAARFMLNGFAWPVAAVKELLSGQLTAKETDIPIMPR